MNTNLSSEARLREALDALKVWEHWYSVDSTEFNRDTAREMGLKALGKKSAPLSGEAVRKLIDDLKRDEGDWSATDSPLREQLAGLRVSIFGRRKNEVAYVKRDEMLAALAAHPAGVEPGDLVEAIRRGLDKIGITQHITALEMEKIVAEISSCGAQQ